MSLQFISMEEFASVQEAQAGITRLFMKAESRGKFLRIMRNQEPLGVLIPNSLWDSLIEDLEALSSPNYLLAIEKSRRSSKSKDLSSVQIKRMLKIKN